MVEIMDSEGPEHQEEADGDERSLAYSQQTPPTLEEMMCECYHFSPGLRSLQTPEAFDYSTPSSLDAMLEAYKQSSLEYPAEYDNRAKCSAKTPASLEDMITEHNQFAAVACRMEAEPFKAAQTGSRLLNLPRELRDTIYREVLLANDPIELAPFCEWSHSDHHYDDMFSWPREAVYVTVTWHNKQWKEVYSPSLRLLRVCQQIHCEASAVFYGQPFRFTESDTGWVIFDSWLKQIGPENRELLKDITVCHPGWSSPPTDLDPTTSELSDHPGIAFNHVDWHRSMLEAPNQGWDTVPDPVHLLSEVKGLKKLTLTLTQDYGRDHAHAFRDLIKHPIHDFEWANGQSVENSILNLICGKHFSRKDSFDVCLEGCNDDEGPEALWSFYEELQFHAHRYFREVEAKGWKVVEQRYGPSRTYPVENAKCCCGGNTEFCFYVQATGNCWNLCEAHGWTSINDKVKEG